MFCSTSSFRHGERKTVPSQCPFGIEGVAESPHGHFGRVPKQVPTDERHAGTRTCIRGQFGKETLRSLLKKKPTRWTGPSYRTPFNMDSNQEPFDYVGLDITEFMPSTGLCRVKEADGSEARISARPTRHNPVLGINSVNRATTKPLFSTCFLRLIARAISPILIYTIFVVNRQAS